MRQPKYTMRKWMRLVEYYQPDYIYVTKCVDGGHGPGGEALHHMSDIAESITYEQFISCVGTAQMRQVFPMYHWENENNWDDDEQPDNGGITMQGDYTMKGAFHRSEWYGIPCVYCVWSAIEFVFTRDGKTPESEGINRQAFLMSLDDDELTYYYHITPTKNVASIETDGLKPQRGERSQTVSETEDLIYLFRNRDDAENALGNWLGDQFNDDEPLALLQVALPEDFPITSNPHSFEVTTNQVIPHENIFVIDDNFGG